MGVYHQQTELLEDKLQKKMKMTPEERSERQEGTRNKFINDDV